MAIEFVSAFFSVIVDHSIAPMGRLFGYVFNYKSNMEKLKKQLDKLTDMKTRVQHSVHAATRNGEEIEQDVQKWLTRVNKLSVDARKIITKGEERGQLECFKGLRCPNPKSRHGLSRKAAEEAKNLSKLLEVRFDKVSFCPPPQGMGITSVKGYQAFESRKRTLDGVMEGLRDPNVNMIGVYGMGGVGKTTLVKEVAQKTKQENLFDTVVMAEVSQNPDIKKIQGIIADKLGLQFREESLPGRAGRLCDRLKKERMILIILDDIWEKLDLKEVGIPLGDDHKVRDDHKVGVCKILLTSRDEDVLSCGMDTQKNFLVGVLQEEEAWDLFKEKAGESVESPDLRPTAFEVAKKCACLPIAIVTVATSLKNKSLSVWKNALRELQRPSARSSTGILDDVYGPIELSYNHLESEELKFTFLFCGFTFFLNISYLLRCGMGLGLFKGVKTMEEARDRVHTLLHSLEASCLLLDCSTSNELINMHDVIRDVAISIASREHHVFARYNEVIGPKDWPDTNMLKNCTAICLHSNDISELSEEIECPTLNFLFIYDKGRSLKIPKNFFRGMREVRVLDLSGMRMSSLPPSFNLLANLRTLCLDDCQLGDIALVGELKKLEILTLLSSDVEQLPKEFGQLTQLKLLDLSDCTKLKVIPPGVLSSLSHLEELHMFNSFDQWEDEGPNDQRSNASLAELKPLAHLTTLQIHVRDARLMPKDLFFEKLERYQILIGDDEWVWSGTFRTLKLSGTFRTLKLKHITSHRLADGILMLLKKTEDLYLDELKGVENALCKLDREGFPRLKHLHVQNSPEIRYIINLLVRLNAFPLLESLFLHNLINLEKICHGKLTSKSFSKLRKIKVGSCGRLRHLFSFSLAKNLLQLQEIEVLDCENMTAIVSEEIQDGIADDEATEKIELSQLRSLTLQCLLMLISFHYNENTPSTSQSRMPLFDQKTIMFPGLEALKLSSINVGKIWQEQLSEMPSSFRNLGSLVLEGCDCLEYVFSSSMAQTLVQLKRLEICECEMMQKIVVTTKFGAEERKDMMLFPKLTFLKMKDLQNLTSFCSEENMEFSSLKQLHIENCPKLTAFVVKSKSPGFISSKELKDMNVEQTCTSTEFLFNEKVIFPMLEEVRILHMDNLKNIWHNQLSVDSFWKLKRVQVENCKKLSIVFPACVARGLTQLEKLIIESCGVEYIVAKEEAVEAATETEFLFPRVSFLRLWKLPELKSFYPGIHSSEWPMLKTLDVYHCDKLKVFATDSRSSQGTLRDLQLDIPTQQPLLFVEKVVPNLELLTLNSDDIKMINQHGEFPSYLFCRLKFLELMCFHDKSAVVPLGFLQRFQNLEKLSLVCSYFEELFSDETLEGEEKHAEIFTWIRNLSLNGLFYLKHIWKQDCRWEVVLQNLETLEVWYCDSLINLAPSSASLQNLTTLDVWKCTSLINLVTSSTAKSLMQLKIMKIRECHRVTEIVSHNEVDETEEIIFIKLEDLILDKLSSLSSFCSVNYTFKFPSLEMVVVSQCPKLKIFSHGVLSTPLLHRVWLTEKRDEGRWERDLNATIQLLFTKMDGFCNLEYLTLSEFPRLVQIWHADAQNILDFKDLKVLKVDKCSSLRILFTQSMALCLVRLEMMEIKDCTTMEKIITKEEGGGGAELDKIKFPRLETLLLESCPHLSCFYSGSDTLECPSLKTITIRDCPNMKTFASMFQREQNPPWTGSYGIMEPLGERDLHNPTVSFFSEKILFPNLEKLELSSMTIAKIWPDQSLKITSCIQNLKELTVKDCGSLKYLLQSSVVKSLVQLERLEVHNCKIMERVMVTEASDDEGFDMLFLNLYDLRVENLPKLTRFCNGNLIEFPSLRWLVIKKCPELKAFISNAMSAEMTVSKDPVKKNLEDKLPADIQPLFDEKVGVASLERLIIDEIENLEKIWHNQLAVDSFSKLDYFSVRNCKRLSSIFPSNMSSRLQRLDSLQILNCASLEVIFEHQVPNFTDSNGVTATQLIAVEAAHRFVFSQVTILKLQELPELKSFYSGFHTTEWSLLKKLELYGCGKVEVFASEFMSFQEKHRESQLEIPIQQPLFLVNKVTFPNLEELSLERNNVMMEIWHGKFSVEYFYKLKFLELIKFPEPVFPFHFLQTLPNLEKLFVSDASFKEIFQFEGLGDEEKVAGTLTRLRNLKLSKLPELMHLWKEEFQSDLIFQNLEYLELLECGKLKNLVPSSVSFENLTGLEVSKCHGLINLVERSTAKSLVLLKRMCIVDCEMIEEIIENEGGEVKDGIIFSNLKYLRLDCLPNLGSFCSGDYAFDFPSLEEVIMGGCPKMNIFSQGVLSTPKLKRLQGTEGEDKRHWAGNFNTTIQQLFIEMKNVQNFEED